MRNIISTAALASFILLTGCADAPAVAPPAESLPSATVAASAQPATVAQVPDLRRVASDEVCMMNNRFMKEKQIPVEVEGRTYFGCCAMCKTKLENDPAARTAVDPVSGKQVDKATAVIGAKANNTVVYFENEQSFDAYVRGGSVPASSAAATSAPVSPAASSAPAPASTPASPAPSPRPSGTVRTSVPAPASPPVPPTKSDPAPSGNHQHEGHSGH